MINEIIAEVERLKKDKPYGEIPQFYYLKGLDGILFFLSTLQEQPVCEELEEAAERYEHNRVYQDELDKYANYLDSLEEGETPQMKEPSPETKYLLNADMIESFKAGANWQKEQGTRDMYMSDNRHFQKVYELGKKDMKEQMMKAGGDLENAAREYAMDDFYNGYSTGSIVEDTMKNFKAGAEWGRRNVLQEIADGKVHPVDRITAAWLDDTEE